MADLTVERFYQNAGKRLRLRLVAGRRGLHRVIRSARVQKAGLALTGDAPFDFERVQVLGEKEMMYLGRLDDDVFAQRLESMFHSDIPLTVVTRNQEIPPRMLQLADRHHAPLFRTALDSDEFMSELSRYFQEAFSRVGTVHGVLVEVFGLGVLIIGASGVGKSELALDLISRGHRLVADDVIDVTVTTDGQVIGSGSHLIKHHMELRGPGILNVRDLFGISAIKERQQVDLVVELVDWDQRKEYDRLGLDEKFHKILDQPVSLLQIPVSPGRNLTTIVEVATRNQLLKQQGIHSVEELHKKLSWAMDAEALLGGDDIDGDEDQDD